MLSLKSIFWQACIWSIFSLLSHVHLCKSKLIAKRLLLHSKRKVGGKQLNFLKQSYELVYSNALGRKRLNKNPIIAAYRVKKKVQC
jgi:hypothetical protein